jgi:hypothetical protein
MRLADRVFEAENWEELAPADQELILKAESARRGLNRPVLGLP